MTDQSHAVITEPTARGDRRAWMMRLLIALLGMMATLLPWAYHALTREGFGTHQDLWLTLALFGAAFTLALGGWERSLPRWGRWAFGAACAFGAAIGLCYLPAKWSDYRERAASPRGVDHLLARQLAQQIGQFSVVALAGVAGTSSVWWRQRRA